MNPKERAFKRIIKFTKENKKSEKVELGNMTALKGALSILKNIENNAEPFVDDFTNKVSTSIDSYNKMIKHRNVIYNFIEREVKGILRTFESNAKELGIKADTIPEYKEVVKLQEKGQQVYKLLDSFEEPKSQ